MTYVLNRLLSVILTLFLITLITFAITNILPGDVAMMIMGTQSNPEALAGLRQSLGLNDPLLVQYGRWVGGMLTGDWGDSLIFKKPIAELLSQKIVASAIIVVMSMTIALALAIPLGVWAAVHRDKWQDTASSSTALLGVSLPDFFWGIVMILVFARWLGWFPSSGFVDPSENFVRALRHAFLPSLALGLGLMAHLTRMTRSTMIGILGQEFIRVARAKGLSERTVIWRYALANAIGPVITIAGLQIGYLFGSIIVMETLFNYTGMGWLTYQALLNRDMPLIQASVFVIAAVVMLTNLVVDLLYVAIDPRIRLD
ncbi:peptide/nickel transport system permease protein [Pseudorhodobacter antarcticus]|jgi:peptide/nickel transport system permease protein|uniref:Peptide/nickel transport system permease protein n=1 Tax=Pseudorhodobacter antarcticus TaxID=1077947 RepID=A0A1H8KA00_9RHOB|nr:ABC transporter permease [Pseudorhodobacter antarcticus]SEN89734.1 peptide/nickel transport system permease protein [Pseudorhodobacter antarcticus]